MARTDTLTNFLTDVADSIRNKTGKSDAIACEDFDTEIESISGGGDLDWSAIGYDTTPESITEGYNYAKEIQEEWTPTSRLVDGYKDVLICPYIDISSRTSLSLFAYQCRSLISIPLLDTSNVTDMGSTFSGCSALTIIPLLDTSNVANMSGTFAACSSLTTIPLLNTSNVTNMYNMVYNSPNLSNNSLDNILQMCIGATSYTGTKTLKTLGFTNGNYPVSRIQALPHYQDFIDAGWTIGY